MSHVRTNAHPVILASGASRDASAPVNVILSYARDLRDGIDSAYDLLFATQILRVAYDSPRIGGGIDPAVATNVPGLASGREECPMLAYLIGDDAEREASNADTGADADYQHMGALENIPTDRVQDMIVHAEAVALRLIRAYEAAGVTL